MANIITDAPKRGRGRPHITGLCSDEMMKFGEQLAVSQGPRQWMRTLNAQDVEVRLLADLLGISSDEANNKLSEEHATLREAFPHLIHPNPKRQHTGLLDKMGAMARKNNINLSCLARWTEAWMLNTEGTTGKPVKQKDAMKMLVPICKAILTEAERQRRAGRTA
jgi:hypothetical protein